LLADANDFATYTTLSSLIDTVNANVDALPDSAANDYNTYTTVTGLIDTVQDNVAAVDNNAWTNANDYATYSTLVGLIDTVQDNVDAQTSNTQIYVADTLLSNTALIFEAGSGISLSANATTHVTTITTSMSNVTSQEIAIDGSSNSFTLIKSAANTNMLLVSYEGILQKPREYSVDGTTLTLSNTRPLVAGANLEVRYFDFFELSGVSEGGGGGYTFQGTVSGYAAGGFSPNITQLNTIDKFPFSSDTNATDVGDLSVARAYPMGQSSSSSGYSSGGSPFVNVIDKFPFAADANASDVGDLTVPRERAAGHSSVESGYSSGGTQINPLNMIDKFPFASDGNATDVGDLTSDVRSAAGQSSATSGYNSGGYGTPSTSLTLNKIDKFSFSSDGNATDAGDLTQGRNNVGGQSSVESGYSSGGLNPALTNMIDKFPFAADANATDVGDLTQARSVTAGQSSTVSGYNSSGFSPTYVNTIDKFSFSSDGNATDVGDLTQVRLGPAGQQI
jgi:hypothetical protein